MALHDLASGKVGNSSFGPYLDLGIWQPRDNTKDILKKVLLGVQEVPSSNLGGPTKNLTKHKTSTTAIEGHFPAIPANHSKFGPWLDPD